MAAELAQYFITSSQFHQIHVSPNNAGISVKFFTLMLLSMPCLYTLTALEMKNYKSGLRGLLRQGGVCHQFSLCYRLL